MSIDFYIWAGPRLTPDEFVERLMLIDNGSLDEESVFRRSDRLLDFHRAVTKAHPPLEQIDEEAARGSPWAMTPVASPYLVAIYLGPGSTITHAVDMGRAAIRRGLYVYGASSHLVTVPHPARWQIYLRRIGLGRFAGPDP